MTEDDAVAAIQTQLAAGWAVAYPTNAPPLVGQNETLTPPQDGSGNPLPFVQYEIEFTPIGFMGTLQMGPISIGDPGNNLYRKWGLIIGRCFAAVGAGDDVVRGIAGKFLRIFQAQDFGDVSAIAGTVHGGEKSDDGVWWNRTASIPFFFDDYS